MELGREAVGMPHTTRAPASNGEIQQDPHRPPARALRCAPRGRPMEGPSWPWSGVCSTSVRCLLALAVPDGRGQVVAATACVGMPPSVAWQKKVSSGRDTALIPQSHSISRCRLGGNLKPLGSCDARPWGTVPLRCAAAARPGCVASSTWTLSSLTGGTGGLWPWAAR